MIKIKPKIIRKSKTSNKNVDYLNHKEPTYQITKELIDFLSLLEINSETIDIATVKIALNKYISNHKLQVNDNRSFFKLDNNLKKLFSSESETMSYNTLNVLLKKFFIN